ncbi:unnamed protein product [Rhizoctonia solani]|uniref:Protein kinase domain-containing protein n=1 Tax=Rhizoctonia solani TaxID=456999 RepID=A0A8H2XW16_9AGAM|nr:unnamed protein product [Rhizoctonia solani]
MLTSPSPRPQRLGRHEGASTASLYLQVSNLSSSRSFISDIISPSRPSLLMPSPPQVETALVHAHGEIRKFPSGSTSPSISLLRLHAPSPEVTKVADSTSTSKPTLGLEAKAPAAPGELEAVATLTAPQPLEPTWPETALADVLQPKLPPNIDPEAPTAPAGAQTVAICTVKGATVPLFKAPLLTKTPTPKRIPVKSFIPHSASTRYSYARWARERERKWGTGLPVPKPPTPKKSEDNIKRHFSLGRMRRPSVSQSPNESSNEIEKKSNWGAKRARATAKMRKEENTDVSSITSEASSVDVPTGTRPEPRPSLATPTPTLTDQRQLSDRKPNDSLKPPKNPETCVVLSDECNSLQNETPYIPVGSMSIQQMFDCLIGAGCIDLSPNMDTKQETAMIVSGGGFGDIWKGKLYDGSEVAIKAWRTDALEQFRYKTLKVIPLDLSISHNEPS